MKRSIILALAFVLASFGMTALETQAQGVSPCAGKEPVRYVAGGKECLVYKAFGADAAGKDPTLVVFLNGDLFQEGGAADDMYKYAAQFARPGVIGVAILRPAFSDREGNKSTDGERSREFDSYTPRNIESVALAIDALKRRYGAKRVILVAHTAGAAYAGVILGKYPELAQGAILATCICNIVDWRNMARFRAWSVSLSPSDFVGGIPKTRRVIAINNTSVSPILAQVSKKYVQTLTERGIKAEYRETPDSDRDFRYVGDSKVFADALESLISETAP